MSNPDYEKDLGFDDKPQDGTTATVISRGGPIERGQIEEEGIREGEDLHRGLKARQISMIAIGGSIGTGLVIGSGAGLSRGGPVGLLIAYVVMGAMCFGVMCSLGEMATQFPHKKGFGGYATRFVDPSMGFALGWNYLLKYLVVTPNNITAGAIVVQYWTDKVPVAAWITIYIVGCFIVNCLGIEVFGEVEFWASFLKIITLTGLILVGIIIDLGGAGVERIGFRYWRDQPFSHYIFQNDTGVFLGFWSCMVTALFAYMGCELVGVTFGEAKNPRKTVPATIRRTFWRLLIFYVGSIFVVGLLVKATDPELLAATKKSTSAAASPFVLAIQRANIKILPDIINGAILLFVLSAANSDLYIGSRTLYALAAEGQAPRFFMRTNRWHTPYYSLLFCTAICCIAYMNVSSGSKKVFGYFTALVTIFGALTWMSILWSHIRFMKALKAQGISRDTLPWKAPFQPYFAWVCLIFVGIVTFFKGFDSFTPKFKHDSFITAYLGLPIYAFLYFGHKLYYKTRVIKPEEVDLVSGRKEFDMDQAAWEEEEAARGKLPWWKKLWEGA
ncbi:uncharacterized protein JCM6883_004006 [Sporobolomyces salmoneus]|uniref:uncharacterized protein n=1 Tax=Sporobolomyces salmoneus TaxID=183962 RepID=UPI00316F3BB2